MWEPRRLTTLWASKACYRYSFTFYLIMRPKLAANLNSVSRSRQPYSPSELKFLCDDRNGKRNSSIISNNTVQCFIAKCRVSKIAGRILKKYIYTVFWRQSSAMSSIQTSRLSYVHSNVSVLPAINTANQFRKILSEFSSQFSWRLQMIQS
jgi:hypothetical protein